MYRSCKRSDKHAPMPFSQRMANRLRHGLAMHMSSIIGAELATIKRFHTWYRNSHAFRHMPGDGWTPRKPAAGLVMQMVGHIDHHARFPAPPLVEQQHGLDK